ncbi:hypothetical protein B0H67DRAFT_349197 [Lasiosphaeris hirsuta]|uniref:Uncharacterized protein n=1 Tax=Lasiosphaeris hirsuta TaxID=260670 RepID=A0AA39ZVR5_9PEZI|nr:hypothetical protein B0H67DRAFT_349197 [Lasiosphaeris hirsuta]
MSRFETNRHRLDYEYGYDSSWDTRSNSYREVLSPPRRSLSGGNMIIYDMDRPDPRHHQHHHRHSHRTRDSKSSRASHREQREADRQTTAYLLTDREDREKESLKQRMSLSRTSLAPSRRHTSSKARSLSLSRSRSFANTSSDSDLDSADDSEDPDRERNQAHRPLVKYYQTEPAAPPPQLPPAVTWPSGHGGHGGGGGHDHRRRSRPPSSSLSLGRRASRSPDLDLGLAEEGDEGGRGRYQRGFGLIEQRHGQSHSADPRVEVMAEDLRFGLGRMGLGPDGRVLGGGARVLRSAGGLGGGRGLV